MCGEVMPIEEDVVLEPADAGEARGEEPEVLEEDGTRPKTRNAPIMPSRKEVD